MDRYIPDIQERLRKAGYPRFEPAQIQEITFGPKGPAPEIVTRTQWVFSDRDSTIGITLSQDFIALQTTRYESFESFVEILEQALAIAHEHVQFDLAERLGLRYVDVVEGGGGDDLEAYFSPGVTGLPAAALGVEKTDARFEQRAETTTGFLIVRITKSEGQVQLPPDLAPLASPVDPERSGTHVVLDFDHFSPLSREFDVEGIIDVMWQLHDGTDAAFRAAVTEHALANWGMETT